MEFRDLKVQYQENKAAIDKAISSVLEKGDYISGKAVTELEKKLAEYVGVKYCISCANGTDALQLALLAWEIGKGDAVFVPDFTFFSTAEVVSMVGATPIFVDVDKNTFNMSPFCLEKAIQKVIDENQLIPKVVIAVDLFGLTADYSKIKEISQKYELLLLEDGAQGFGGVSEGKRACGFGDISTTSFFPAKPLGCYGDGGAIFTDNSEWASLLQSLKVHGKGQDKYDNVHIGMNSRLDTLQAAILIEKLKVFESYELEQCNKVAEKYTALLADKVITPTVPAGMVSSWAQYTIRLKNKEQRDSLQIRLREENIPSMVYYVKPLHKQDAFSDLNVSDEDLQNTCELCDTVLSLPMHPYLENSEIERVCLIVAKYLEG